MCVSNMDYVKKYALFAGKNSLSSRMRRKKRYTVLWLAWQWLRTNSNAEAEPFQALAEHPISGRRTQK